MNRLLVLLVASMLGTGCVVSDNNPPIFCDARTVSVGWSSFRLANNSVVSTCSAAGIGNVQVFMDDQLVTTVACSGGGVNVTGVLNDGNHLFTVEGLDSSTSAIALRDEATVSNSNCDNLVVDTQPSEGTFVLNYSFSPNFCTSATNSYIWFALHDDISNDVIVYDLTHSPTTYTCGNGSTTTPVPISFALASGPYTLQRTEEVLYPGPTQEAGNCNATALTMAGGTQTQVNVAMTDGAACF